MGEVAEPGARPDEEGDAKPPGTGLPKRGPSPSLGPGRIDHPLPNLSAQDAARIARILADERAELEAQAARRAAGQPARTSRFPASVPLRFRPSRGPAVASVPDWPLPVAPGQTADPPWHALGTMVAQLLGGNDGARTGVTLADRPSKVLVADTEAELASAAPADDGAEPDAAAAVEEPAAPADPAVEAVQETFRVVQAAGDEAAAYFYGRMFVRNPELRKLFPTGMSEQRDRLFRAFGRIVGSLSTPEEMATYLAQLGRDHRKYSVQPEMYEVVGDALMATLRAYAGPAFTPAAEQAWAQAYQAVSSLMIAAAEHDSKTSPPLWTAEVVSNEERRPGISILTVAPDQPLPYEPGQHISVQTPRWPKVWRPYSVACRPREDGLMTFHVKAVPGGWVSNALVHNAAPGDELILGPALGTMTLDLAGGRDLLCVAGGTGLSPIKAIIEEAIRQSTACPRQIHLFYGARTREELYDLPELWHLADAYPGFQLTPVTSDDPAFDGMQGNVGRVAARYLPHRECEAYVAGPPAMVQETVRVLGRVGLPRERIHYDDALLADGE